MNLVDRYIKESTCEHCGRQGMYPKRRKTNTAYHEEELNYVVECDDCFEETERHWEEMWKDYYSGRI